MQFNKRFYLLFITYFNKHWPNTLSTFFIHYFLYIKFYYNIYIRYFLYIIFIIIVTKSYYEVIMQLQCEYYVCVIKGMRVEL